MNGFISRFIFCALLLLFSLNVADAAPDPSCARKFVGSWTTRVLATGQTYPGVILPNGVSHVTCPMCRPTGTWTCSGNTIMFIGIGSMSLSPDGRTMTSGCCISTRMGGALAVDTAGQEKPTGQAEKYHKAAASPHYSGQQQSADCSDITGTNSTAPAATNCKEAITHLHAARINRAKYPAVSAEQYKTAAAAARRAGDPKLELSILREAAAPAKLEPPVPNPASEEACAVPMREAAPDITGAQAIEKNDPTCAGLTQAAENYFAAGKIFNRAMLKLNQPIGEVAKSCEFKLQNLLFLRRDALNDRVEKMKQEGRCQPGPSVPPPPDSGNPKKVDDDAEQHKKDCAEMLPILAAHAPPSDPNWLVNEMASSHCKPDGTPMTLREYLMWSLSGNH